MDAEGKRIGCWSAVGIVWFLALAWAPYSRYDENLDYSVTRYVFLGRASQLSPGGWNTDWWTIVSDGIVGTLILCNGFLGFRPEANQAQRIATLFAAAFNVCCGVLCLILRIEMAAVVWIFGALSILQWLSLLFLLAVQSFQTPASKDKDPLRQHR